MEQAFGRGHRLRLWLFGLLSLGIMLGIFLLSAQPAAESSSMSQGLLTTPFGQWISRILPQIGGWGPEHSLRKYAHMFEYFCLGISLSLFTGELLAGRSRRIFKAAGASMPLAFLYACSDEWHQRFVPGRSGQFSDVLVDSAGALGGILLIALASSLWGRRQSQATERK